MKSKEAATLISKEKQIIILDVRTADEFNAGHLKGAINIDIRKEDALSKIDKLDRNATYLVHCRTGRRSQIAVDNMLQKGFKLIYHMTDGYSGWENSGLPVEKN